MDTKLGQRYRDTHSGFEGIANAVCDYLYGCRSIQLDGVDKDGLPKKLWFDEPQIALVESRPVAAAATRRTGGERSDLPEREYP